MKMPRTPSEIEVLLHCHFVGELHPRRNTPAVRGALGELEAEGFIKYRLSEDIYDTTARGRAWVEELCKVLPPPMDDAQKLEMALKALYMMIHMAHALGISHPDMDHGEAVFKELRKGVEE